MNESLFAVSIPILAVIVSAISGYIAARYAGKTSLAIKATEVESEESLIEKANILKRSEALWTEMRQEMSRLHLDNQELRIRVSSLEKELFQTRKDNLILEVEREKRNEEITRLSAELQWIKNHVKMTE